MEIHFTKTIDTSDEDESLYVHIDDMAKQLMQAKIAEELGDAEYKTSYKNITHGEDDVTISAVVDVVDPQWVLESTDDWQEPFHQAAPEAVYLPIVKTQGDGVLLRGTVLADVELRDNPEAEDAEAKQKAKSVLKNSGFNVAGLEFGRVIGANSPREVQFVLTLGWSTAFVQDVTRIQEQAWSASNDWDEYVVIS